MQNRGLICVPVLIMVYPRFYGVPAISVGVPVPLPLRVRCLRVRVRVQQKKPEGYPCRALKESVTP